MNKEVEKLKREVRQWQEYAEAMASWRRRYFRIKDGEDQMNVYMSEPNKPGYYRANND